MKVNTGVVKVGAVRKDSVYFCFIHGKGCFIGL